jgi:hypothetical protein
VRLDDDQALDQALEVFHPVHRREQVGHGLPVQTPHAVTRGIEDLQRDFVLVREDRAADFELRARLLV